jgi:MraZ protein
MFFGTYNHSIDNKGRLSIPSRFRDVLREHYQSSRLVLAPYEDCVFAYPVSEWEKVESEIKKLSHWNTHRLKFDRLFYSRMDSVEIDGQGRISLVPVLRSYASLDKEAVVVGASARFEIWSRGIWDEYIQKEKDQVENLAQLLVGGPVEE